MHVGPFAGVVEAALGDDEFGQFVDLLRMISGNFVCFERIVGDIEEFQTASILHFAVGQFPVAQAQAEGSM